MRFLLVVSFAFGKSHGLGFTGALREIGLPGGDIALALLAFSIGVEIEQIFFLVLVAIAGYLVRLPCPAVQSLAGHFQRLASYAIGRPTGFRVIERVVEF